MTPEDWHNAEHDYDDLRGLHREGQEGIGWKLLMAIALALLSLRIFT